MAINKTDMTELRRLSTNFYDADKACINRIIMGISRYEKEIHDLKIEIDQLKIKAASKKETK